MIGTARPAAQARGSPRGRRCRAGRGRGRRRRGAGAPRAASAASPVGGEVDVVAARAEVDRRARAGSAARRRRRGRGSFGRPQALSDDREPAAGRVLDLELAAHRLDEAPRDREAEPDACRRWLESPSRWNGWNSRSRSAGGMPGPRSTTRRSTRPSTAPAVDPHRRLRRARTRPRCRHVGERALEQAGSAGPRAASRARRARPTSSRDAEAAQRRRDDLLEADARWRRISSAPVCSRLMSSRLPTSALSRSVSSSIVSRNSRRRLRRPVDVVAGAGS